MKSVTFRPTFSDRVCKRLEESIAQRQNEQRATHVLVPREHLSVIRFALHRFMWEAHHRSVAAAQDKEGRHYKPGDFEKFDDDMKKAEAALAALPNTEAENAK